MANNNQDTFEVQYTRAVEAAAEEDAREPRAKSAYYDAAREMITIELRSGAEFSFPPRLAQGLAGASPEHLAEVEVTPSGYGLHWETLDADFTVTGLLGGVFGTKGWMREFASKGGRSRSDAKAEAARENGKKGGRPRRVRTTSA